MTNDEKIKEMVRQKYGEIALQDKETGCSCCSGTYTVMSEDYSQLDGYNPDADFGLGCGLPTQFAQINKGDTVIDLGSGAGNDCFVTRAETGETGKVIGIDFTPAMIDKARINAEKRGFNNVEFRQGDIENMPVADNTANVIVSNCVLNLVPNKKAVFKEMYRVLKPGGHFSISDIVLTGELPEKLKSVAEMYAGCVSGAIQKAEYLDYIQQAGFQNISIHKEKQIIIPDDILQNHLSAEQITAHKANPIIWSVTVYAEKQGCSVVDCGCSKNGKLLSVEYLYLDLSCCDRCQGGEQNLETALEQITPELFKKGYYATLKKVYIDTEQKAIEHKFLSSPTIRVNGFDIIESIKENNCSACGTLAGDDSIECRTFVYNGKNYDTPPVAMLSEAILKFSDESVKPQKAAPYKLPKNLKKYFEGKKKKESCSCGCSSGCC